MPPTPPTTVTEGFVNEEEAKEILSSPDPGYEFIKRAERKAEYKDRSNAVDPTDLERMLEQPEPLDEAQVKRWMTLSAADIAMVNLIARGAVHPVTKRPIRNVQSILSAIRMKLEASQPKPRDKDDRDGQINVTVNTLPLKGEPDAK